MVISLWRKFLIHYVQKSLLRIRSLQDQYRLSLFFILQNSSQPFRILPGTKIQQTQHIVLGLIFCAPGRNFSSYRRCTDVVSDSLCSRDILHLFESFHVSNEDCSLGAHFKSSQKGALKCAPGRIRTFVGRSRQIYSLL